MFDDFIKAVEEKAEKVKNAEWDSYRARSESEKDHVLDCYKHRFPLLWGNVDLSSGHPGWLALPNEKGLSTIDLSGSPGVVVGEFIFAVERTQADRIFVIADYIGEGVDSLRSIEIDAKVSDPDKALSEWLKEIELAKRKAAFDRSVIERITSR